MSPTQAEQPVTVVTKSGPPCPPRTSRATKRGTLGPNEPFLACFWPFPWAGWFQIGCNSDVWAGRSVAMIWTPHTPIFGLKTILAQNWTTKLKKSGQNRPFGEKRKIPKITRMNLVPENRFLRVVLLVFLVLFHSGQRLTATAIRQDRAARSIQTLPWFDPFFVAIENHWKQWWNDTKNHSCKHAFLCKLNLRNFLCIRFSKPKVASPSKAGSLRQYQCKRK